jgi:S-adenosyl methyltransferase
MSGRQEEPKLDTRHAHSARVYNYWLGGKDNFAADREAAALLSSSSEGRTAYVDADLRDTSAVIREASRTLDFSAPVALLLLIILQLIPDPDDPYGIVASLLESLPAGSYLVLAHPASDIRAASMAEMTRRVNERMSGPQATMRDRAAITRFFDGLDLLEPGVVQPQQWRPEPAVISPDQVTAWCGVARKG